MFDAGRGGGSDCVSYPEPNNERTEKRQYTLKGIEAETIQLMRDAANYEGMKIGSWVSLRMREAAQSVLSDGRKDDLDTVAEPLMVLQHINAVIESYRQETDVKLLKIERELHELTSGQRSILSALLSNK